MEAQAFWNQGFRFRGLIMDLEATSVEKKIYIYMAHFHPLCI